jgi:hypothetical protein
MGFDLGLGGVLGMEGRLGVEFCWLRVFGAFLLAVTSTQSCLASKKVPGCLLVMQSMETACVQI